MRFFFLLTILLSLCPSRVKDMAESREETDKILTDSAALVLGNERLNKLLPMLESKRIACVVNHSSLIGGSSVHLIDTLIRLGLDLRVVFAPEHGFRGEASAGERIEDERDGKTGLPVISLYGKKKKPLRSDLENVDVVVFDIQDVGARFYTYLSTLHYILEACCEYDKECIVLDRPNPQGAKIDGPVLEPAFRSFVGLHPVPVTYGMTIGEYARMIAGEGWTKCTDFLKLTIMIMENYSRDKIYHLPIRPSPNLPTTRSILLYPGLCLFEGTIVSVGRGTMTPFEVIGYPKNLLGDYEFIPVANAAAKYPPHEGEICRGNSFLEEPVDSLFEVEELHLSSMFRYYHRYRDSNRFFLSNHFIDKLAGTDQLRKDIMSGKSEQEIRMSWQEELNNFKQVRKKYLLYPE